MTVAQLLAQISSQELSEWLAYYQLEPFGEAQAERRMGTLAAVTANGLYGRKQPFKPGDFMLDYDGKADVPNEISDDEREQQVQRMIGIAAMWTAALGGQDLRQ